LRPERLHVQGHGGGANRLAGRAVQVVFRGDHVRLCVSIDRVGEVHAKVPRREAVGLPAPGDPVTLSWSATGCVALPPLEDSPVSDPSRAGD